MANLVFIDDVNILQTYGFRLVGSPVINPAKVRRKTVKVPGGDGVVDYSMMYGKPVFENRDIKFSVFSPFNSTFSQRRENLFQAFHGQRVKVQFSYDDDPAESQYYYDGVLEFQRPKSVGSTIYPVAFDADPFKYKTIVNTSGSGNGTISGTNNSRYLADVELAITDSALVTFTSYITLTSTTAELDEGRYTTIDLYLLGLRIGQGAFSFSINALGDYTAKVIERAL